MIKISINLNLDKFYKIRLDAYLYSYSIVNHYSLASAKKRSKHYKYETVHSMKKTNRKDAL